MFCQQAVFDQWAISPQVWHAGVAHRRRRLPIYVEDGHPTNVRFRG